MKRRSLVPIALALAGAATAGCGDSSPDTTTTLTYSEDIAPLLNDKCARCHQPNGIGPFSVLDFDTVSVKAPLIALKTSSKEMPPFQVTHDGSCGQFEDSEALSPAEIDKIQQWVKGGAKEGTKITLTPPKMPSLAGGTDLHTPMVTPVAAGNALAQFDDYRCFIVDAGLSRDQFITGYDVLPGKPEIVHHVVGFVVDPTKQTKSGRTNAEIMQSLAAAEPAKMGGWTCFGGAGEGLEEESSPMVWAPGQGPVNFPDNLGVQQRPTDKLVIQVHYNLADPKTVGLSDSTTVRIRYVDKVDRPMLFLLPDGFLETLFTQKQPDTLRPGMPKISYTWKKTMAEMGLDMAPTLEIVGVMPHMHQRGRSSELHVMGAGGRNDCLARVDNWNFHWQKFYFYKGNRPTLSADSQVQLTCDYDTSSDHEAVLPGWGTRNEMCLDTMMVVPRAGM
jgi:hypothetical protein